MIHLRYSASTELVFFKNLFHTKSYSQSRTYVRIAYVPCLYQRVMVDEVRMLIKKTPKKSYLASSEQEGEKEIERYRRHTTDGSYDDTFPG